MELIRNIPHGPKLANCYVLWYPSIPFDYDRNGFLCQLCEVKPEETNTYLILLVVGRANAGGFATGSTPSQGFGSRFVSADG